MHRTLVRQLRKLGLSDGGTPPTAEVWQAFLDRVSQAYTEADQDRYLLERSQEIASREMRLLYKSLENAVEGISRLDERQVYVDVNPAYAAMLGRLPGDLTGIHWLEVFHPDDRDRLAAGYQRLLAGEKIEVECRALRPEGVPVHLQVVIMPSVDLNDRFNGHYCFTKDIGTRKQLEDEVNERADALARANEALQSALLHKDRFLANMSHELRTPLNAILGLAEALQEKVYGPLAPAQLKPLGVIVSSGQHLLSLISDVLDVAKIGAGTLKPEYETVDLAALCRECVGIVKPAAQPKQQKVGFAFDGQVTELQADSRRLKQILLNLLSNAVKFTPAGGRLGLEVTGDPACGQVTLTVWDDGIGIAEEDQARLFKPFEQLSGGLSRLHDGTGLGLVLAERLAVLHGGRISVTSALGRGSRFAVILPVSPPGGP